MITAAMLAEAFTETTEPEHRTEVPPLSEAPDEVVQHFQRAADYLNTRSNPPQEERSDPLDLAAGDNNHKALVEAAVLKMADVVRQLGPSMSPGALASCIERNSTETSANILAAFQSRQEEK